MRQCRSLQRPLRFGWQCWNHQGGMEVTEWIAAVMVAVALLGAVALGVSGRGGEVGTAAVDVLQQFVATQSGALPDGSAPGGVLPTGVLPDGGSSGATPTALVSGVPLLLSGNAFTLVAQQGGGQQQADSCGWSNPMGCVRAAGGWIADQWNGATQVVSNWWDSLPGWVQGAIIGFLGALAVVVVVLVLVAAGVIAVASGAVLAILIAVALVVGAVAGAIYVLVTGDVDFWPIFLLGAGLAALILLPLGAALGAIRAGWPALAALGGRLATFARSAGSWIAATARSAGSWIAATARSVGSWVAATARTFGRWTWTGLKWTGRQLWNVITAPYRFARWMLNKKVTFKLFGLTWEWKGIDVLNQLIKLYLLNLLFKDVFLGGKPLEPWQLILLLPFAILAGAAPAAGLARLLVRAVWDVISIFLVGWKELWDKFWKRLTT